MTLIDPPVRLFERASRAVRRPPPWRIAAGFGEATAMRRGHHQIVGAAYSDFESYEAPAVRDILKSWTTAVAAALGQPAWIEARWPEESSAAEPIAASELRLLSRALLARATARFPGSVGVSMLPKETAPRIEVEMGKTSCAGLRPEAGWGVLDEGPLVDAWRLRNKAWLRGVASLHIQFLASGVAAPSAHETAFRLNALHILETAPTIETAA